MIGGCWLTVGVPLYGVTFMKIDDDTLKQLLRINDELLQTGGRKVMKHFVAIEKMA
jgi:hypothetical protein